MILEILQIDDHFRSEHSYLEEFDECYFCGPYFARRGYSAGEINSLILNLKKSPNKKGAPEWFYKEEAIRKAGYILTCLEKWDKFKGSTWVPIPPSLQREDPLFDTRLEDILKIAKLSDYRILVESTSNIKPSHQSASGERLTPDEHYKHYRINDSLREPRPSSIVVFDDLIVTGAHFKAMKRILNEAYPNIKIMGLFIGRREVSNDTEDIDW